MKCKKCKYYLSDNQGIIGDNGLVIFTPITGGFCMAYNWNLNSQNVVECGAFKKDKNSGSKGKKSYKINIK